MSDTELTGRQLIRLDLPAMEAEFVDGEIAPITALEDADGDPIDLEDILQYREDITIVVGPLASGNWFRTTMRLIGRDH